MSEERKTTPDQSRATPLVCKDCHVRIPVAAWEADPAIYYPDTGRCGRCDEAAEGWAQECAVTRWEDDQR
jgi:hypothetical protein